MATAGKAYIIEDADAGAKSKIAPAVFPGTLQGLLDALDAGRYRSAAGTPKVVVIAEGKQRKIIRRFEHGTEVWSASRAEIRHEHTNPHGESRLGGYPDAALRGLLAGAVGFHEPVTFQPSQRGIHLIRVHRPDLAGAGLELLAKLQAGLGTLAQQHEYRMADIHDRRTRHHAGSVLRIALAHTGANYRSQGGGRSRPSVELAIPRCSYRAVCRSSLSSAVGDTPRTVPAVASHSFDPRTCGLEVRSGCSLRVYGRHRYVARQGLHLAPRPERSSCELWRNTDGTLSCSSRNTLVMRRSSVRFR
jgi:hypothetical protein